MIKAIKRILFFPLVLLIIAETYATDNEIVAANNPLIEYTGRIDFSNPLKPGFSYSGVSVRACFQGTSIGIILNDAGTRNYYNVILDRTIVMRLQTKSGQNTFNIASALKDTIHEIEIFRLTEVDFGKTQFAGFVVDKGKALVEIGNKREHLIEFIGNSITCGYGNEGVNGEGSFGPTTENHYLTYAAITSRAFNARHLAVCKSGIGIYRNYDGPVTGSADCMPNLYQRVYLWDASPLYKFAQKPDLICIDLGTNDFSTGKGDSALYVSRYLKFIDTLQVKNKNADILCLLGPMLGGNDLIRVRKYLKLIVDTASKKNNGKVYFFEMSQQTGSLGIGIDYHPNVAQHLKNGKELIKYISALKDWPVLPEVVTGNIKTADDIVLEFNTEIQDLTGNFSGFSVMSDNVTVPVTKAFIDAADKTKIHITPANRLQAGKKITVNYSPGSVEAKNNIKLGQISGFTVKNELTATNLTRAVTDAGGTKITLSFNKLMINPANLDGIRFFDSQNNTLPVEKYTLNSKNIDIFMKNKITAGDSVYLTLSGGIYSTDKVAALSLEKYVITNNSIFTDVADIQLNEFIVYPNPCINKKIRYRLGENNLGNLTASLYDLNGKLIIKKTLTGSSGEIIFNGIKSQIDKYIFRINTAEKEYSQVVFL